MTPHQYATPPPAATAAAQCALASVLLVTSGSTSAMGIFLVPVEAGSSPPSALRGVWGTAMGCMPLLAAPCMIAAALALNSCDMRCDARTRRARLLLLTCVLAFAGFSAAAPAAAESNPVLLFAAVALQAVPLAVVYLVAIELLMAWVPHRPGLAVGCGQTSFAVGTVVFTQVTQSFIDNFGYVQAIALTSTTLVAVAALPAAAIRWPALDAQPEAQPLVKRSTLAPSHELLIPKLHPLDLLRIPTFWFYFITVFTSGASFMLNPYYFKLGLQFDRPMPQLVMLLNVTNLIAIALALVCTALTDWLAVPHTFFWSGAKNVMMLFMLLQTLLFLAMLPISDASSFYGFVVVKALLKIIMISHVGGSAVLAKHLFGAENSSIVFGCGAGLALGFGGACSAWLMTAVDAHVVSTSTPNAYNAYYYIAVVWSLVGFVSSVALSRYRP